MKNEKKIGIIKDELLSILSKPAIEIKSMNSTLGTEIFLIVKKITISSSLVKIEQN
jgi:hypothetical protein